VRFPAPGEEEVAARLVRAGVPAARAAVLAREADGSSARAERLAGLDADEAVASLARAALGAFPAAATEADRLVAELRRRVAEASAAEAGRAAEGDAGEAPEPSGASGEALRRALEDVLHALAVHCRDRAAGLEGGPLAALSEDVAAEALARVGRLAALVRRNVSPAALAIEAVAALRAPAPRGPRG
jgi:hypothetical protein